MNITCRMLLLVVAMLAWFTPAAHARWYDPATGRWTTRDPAGYVDGANLYQFVVANPLRYVDNKGWQAEVPAGEATQGVNPTADQIPQCKDSDGNPISLIFNGNTLKGNDFCATTVSGKNPIRSVTVTRGDDGYYHEITLTFDYSKRRQRIRDEGPLPEGCYYIRSDHENRGQWRHKLPVVPRLGWPPWSPGKWAWGEHDWPLTPFPDTDVDDESGRPRSGFYTHGGSSPGSAGCVDLCNGSDADFHKYMNGVRERNGGPCYIKICARYPSSTSSIVKKVFSPDYACAPRCPSESPWMPK